MVEEIIKELEFIEALEYAYKVMGRTPAFNIITKDFDKLIIKMIKEGRDPKDILTLKHKLEEEYNNKLKRLEDYRIFGKDVEDIVYYIVYNDYLDFEWRYLKKYDKDLINTIYKYI